MLMPPPSPARDETQDDSGFHSGGMSSSTSTEHEQMQGGKTKKKSIMKNLKGSKRSESQPGRMNRCESIDLKEKQKGSSDHHQFRSRSKLLSEQKVAHYGGHFPHMGPHAIYAVHPQVCWITSPWWISPQVHPATPILVGHGQLPPPAAPSKKGNSATVDLLYWLWLDNNCPCSGWQELPEQAGQFAVHGWVDQAPAAAQCLRQQQRQPAAERGTRAGILSLVGKSSPKPST